MFYVTAITLYVFKATPPFADTSIKERLWQLLPRSDYCIFSSCTDLKLLCGKPSPEELFKQTAYNPPDKDVCYLMDSMSCLATWLVMAASCTTDAVTLSQKPSHHSGDWCLRLAPRTRSGACEKWMNEWSATSNRDVLVWRKNSTIITQRRGRWFEITGMKEAYASAASA